MVRFRPIMRRSWSAILLATVVWSALAASASGTTTKRFTATITPEAGIVAGATGVSFTATFTNKDWGVLDAIDLTAPRKFAITDTAQPSPVGIATIEHSILKLRALELEKGESATVEFQASIACKSGHYKWIAREGRGKGNKSTSGYTPDPRGSRLVTSVAGDCVAALVAPGPQDAAKSDAANVVPIRTEDNDPDAAPVQAEILDGAGSRLAASHPLSATVLTVQIAEAPGAGSLVGATSAPSDHGVATFHEGFGITESGIGYVLRVVAADYDIQSGRSDPLSIWDAATECSSSGICSTGVATSPVDGLEGVVTLPEASPGDTVFEGWNLEALNDCEGYEFLSDDQLTFGSTGESFRVIKVAIPQAGGYAYSDKGKPKVQVCFSSSTLQFKTRAGKLATLDAEGFYTGLLPDHGQFHWLGGCSEAPQILSRKSVGHDTVVEYCAPAGSSKGHS